MSENELKPGSCFICNGEMGQHVLSGTLQCTRCHIRIHIPDRPLPLLIKHYNTRSDTISAEVEDKIMEKVRENEEYVGGCWNILTRIVEEILDRFVKE